MIIRLFWKVKFPFPQVSSGQFDLSFDHRTENSAEFSKGFGQPTSKNSTFCSKKFFLKGLLET